MTEPTWFLQLLGGALITLLFVFIYLVFRPHRTTPSRPGSTPEQKAQQKRQQQRYAAHVREVTRPGLIQAAFDRDPVLRKDHDVRPWEFMLFEDDLPISTVLHTHIQKILPFPQGRQVTWLVRLYEQLEEPTRHPQGGFNCDGKVQVTDVAVVTELWDSPRLLCPDFPISRVGRDLLYAQYQEPKDPEVFDQVQEECPSPRVERTERSYTYDPLNVQPAKRSLVKSTSTPEG